MSVEALREHNRLMLMTANPRRRNEMAGVLEAIALACENYDAIANMDNVAIYSTKNDKFIVIEAGSNLYSSLLASNRCQKWTINENAIEALSFIKSKTNVTLSDVYTGVLEAAMSEADKEEKARVEAELKIQEHQSYKEHIETLTEKFKNDPVKLAVLSKLAQELNEIE
jgi:phage-related protein